MNVEVRMGKPDDFPVIWDLLRKKAEFDGGVKLLEASYEEVQAAFFGDKPEASILVAVVDDVLVGIATFCIVFSSFLARRCIWLDDLFVHPECRSRGLGKLLITILAKQAQLDSISRIDWNVASENERGIAFYQSIGAKIRTSTLSARLDEHAISELLRDTA